jgi:hypothetical protein
MASIQVCTLPDDALLAEYQRNGAYTDCYATEVSHSVSHAQYVEAFYTGSVFKFERLLLSWFASRPSTDAQARELAGGALSTFSAWRVEARTADQLLMCDLSGRTRSWLMAAPVHATTSTRLYFGSAVVPVRGQGGSGAPTMGFPFKALLGFHRLYSRVLLDAARSRLAKPAIPGS